MANSAFRTAPTRAVQAARCALPGPHAASRHAIKSRARNVHGGRAMQSPPKRRAQVSPYSRCRSSDAISRNTSHRYISERREPKESPEQQPGKNTQLATTLAESDSSDLVSEVHMPFDPDGVLPAEHPAHAILGNSSLVIQRQIEFMNLMVGFEQANRYIIMDGKGETLGYIAEQDHGIGSAMKRQMFKTHRSFTTHIFDKQEREVLRIHRPFAYINSRIRIYDPVPEGGYENLGSTSTAPSSTGVLVQSAVNEGTTTQVSPLKLEDMRIIGEAQQQWAPLRRKYNLFSYRPLPSTPANDTTPRIISGQTPSSDTKALTEAKVPDAAIEAGMSQFAHVNEPFLSWDFTLRREDQEVIGSVNRNFGGFAREIFTDTGVYALRMDSVAQRSTLERADGTEIAQYARDATAMTLDQRAVMLATAVSIDFDYFSRHSGSGLGLPIPMFWPMGGTAAEGGAAGAGVGAAAGEAGAIGAAEGVGAGAVGAAGRGIGSAAAGEGAVAGAGTIAGVEAMRGYGSRGGVDDASPTNEPFSGAGGENSGSQIPEQFENRPGSDDVWGESSDPWGRGGPGDGPPPSGGAGDSGGEGGSWTDALSDFFDS